MSNRSAENIIRSFGMANQLIIEELTKVQQVQKIDLGISDARTTHKEDSYYQQFDKAVRLEARSMAKHYEIFYCLEKSIRQIIIETMITQEGINWWISQRIPQSIGFEVNKRMKRDQETGMTIRSNEPIDYTTFGELSGIICQNWDIFGSLFSNQKAVERVLSNLNTLRGPIAHCGTLAEDEVLRLNLSVKDWFRTME